MQQLAAGIWSQSAPQSFYGLHVGTRMTVVQLGDGQLLVHSPLAMTPDLKAEVDALGPVRHIIAPNIYHHLYAGDWKAAYPGALLHGARGLAKRRKDLVIDRELAGETFPDWREQLDTALLEGTMLNEMVFLHRPSRSLIVADLIENFETSPHWPTRAYLKLGGIHGKPGLSRPLRMIFRDKKRARRALDRILSWDFDRIVLAHGDILESGGNETLREAYTWLKG
ncbi:MAG TPA: DUF4336 domain-containing protein [Polyangiales bacterium]|nr:DUF4336 domain-containing protein [Polyangiales bacterium]